MKLCEALNGTIVDAISRLSMIPTHLPAGCGTQRSRPDRRGHALALTARSALNGAMIAFSFTLRATDGTARLGTLHTAHGAVETPTFMPVGTAGTVKAMTADAVRATGAEIVLGNTYHLMLRPTAERVARLGGLHRMMDWPGPILTDSGGFQVMSLAKLRKLDADGVTFQSHLDGTKHRLTPARSTEIQHLLDATISMALDECTPFPATYDQTDASLGLSMRWALHSKEAFARPARLRAVRHRAGRRVPRSPLPLGARPDRDRLRRLRDRRPGGRGGAGDHAGRAGRDGAAAAARQAALPDGRRHAGRPAPLGRARDRHVRLRDPDPRGPHRPCLHLRGVLNLRNARFMDDPRPLDPGCDCPLCTRHVRAYLHHLFRAEEMLGPMLLTWHNLTYYQDLMRGMRAAIAEGGSPRMPPKPAPDGTPGMSEQDRYAGLTQLGHETPPAGDP